MSATDTPGTAIDYSEAAHDVITDMPVAGPGDMPIDSQTDTFHGFMSISRYAGTAIVLIVFWSTIFFGMAGGAWLTALSTLGLGLALTAALKLRGAWIPVMVLSCIVFGLIGMGLDGWRDGPVVEAALVTFSA